MLSLALFAPTADRGALVALSVGHLLGDDLSRAFPDSGESADPSTSLFRTLDVLLADAREPTLAANVHLNGAAAWSPAFERMFWDGRVERDSSGTLRSPAGDALLPGLASPLAAQAMFPVLDRAERRGQPGDLTVQGAPNELADIADDDPAGVWNALMTRLGGLNLRL